MSAEPLGFVDAGGYLYCLQCTVPRMPLHDAQAVYYAPHADEPCDDCGAFLRPSLPTNGRLLSLHWPSQRRTD